MVSENQKAAARKYYQKNKPFVIAKARKKLMEYEPRVHNILKNIKRRCSKTGVSYSLLDEDIKIPEICPVLDVPILMETGKGRLWHGPSVDRIDPTKGYHKDNVQVISNRANIMKTNATPDELRAFARWVIKTYGV